MKKSHFFIFVEGERDWFASFDRKGLRGSKSRQQEDQAGATKGREKEKKGLSEERGRKAFLSDHPPSDQDDDDGEDNP